MVDETRKRKERGMFRKAKAKPQWYCPYCGDAKLLTLYVRVEKWSPRKYSFVPSQGEVGQKRVQRWSQVGTVCTSCRFPVVFPDRVPKKRRPSDLAVVERVRAKGGTVERPALQYDIRKHRRATERYFGDELTWDSQHRAEWERRVREPFALYSKALDLYLGLAEEPAESW
jgi:hypothetical protein